nr:MAG: hypothetical protein DIU64_10235 [Caldicoprobacter oshimai]
MPETKDGGWILDDREVNYPRYGKQCVRCKYWMGIAEDFIGSSCKAFKRIPREILEGKHDHRLPFPGDNGIRFEPIDEEEGRDEKNTG